MVASGYLSDGLNVLSITAPVKKLSLAHLGYTHRESSSGTQWEEEQDQLRVGEGQNKVTKQSLEV